MHQQPRAHRSVDSTSILANLAMIAVVLASGNLLAQDSTAYYMANEGLMVTRGETKILFDPLFRDSYGQYLLLPEDMEQALFAGRAPFDGVDAIFISHFHGDHFSPADILRLLQTQTAIQLYAPMQAVITLRAETSDQDDAVFDRVHAVSLAYQDSPVTLSMDGLLIEAVRIPHSGWPTGRLDVENIAWRVTLNSGSENASLVNSGTTVLHLGDADPNDVHFARDAAYWEQTPPHMAFPPYWFLDSDDGLGILRERIKSRRNVGVHVPVSIPADPIQRPYSLRNQDLFINPGETRSIPAQ